MDKRIWLIIALVLVLLLVGSVIGGARARPLVGPATIITGVSTIVKPTATPTPHTIYKPLIMR